MKLQQILKEALERWHTVSGLDFSLLDQNDHEIVSTGSHKLPSQDRLLAFRESNALCLSNTFCHIFKVSESGEPYLLLVFGSADSVSTIGELAVCQVETLIKAYADKNDKNAFIQNVLLNRYTETEVYNKARKLHITLEASRVVYVLEASPAASENITAMVRNIFSSRIRDYMTALDSRELIIIHELSPQETLSEIADTAQMLVDMLNMEAMINARVSYSNPISHLSQLPNAYREACAAMEIGRIFQADQKVCGYSRLGIGRLIYQLPEDICKIFIDEIFEENVLESIDEETLNTIRTFFENNLNLSETSRQLYVHRNTLVYRFEKIQKKFGLDIRTFEDALTFKIAMMVSDLLKYRSNN